MSTPQELCDAKWRGVGEPNQCGIGKTNRHGVVFTGCPACKKESAAGVTPETAEREHRNWIAKNRAS
jgi:hypothetical protein